MFYGISMEDYGPFEGDFTGTVVTGNVIDAAGAMIRRGISMGPYVGCVPEEEARCTIEDYIADGFNVVNWYGFRPEGGTGFDYPFGPVILPPEERVPSIPRSFGLFQNHPNPFNPSTTIEYAVPAGDVVHVCIKVYDLRGRRIHTLVDEERATGSYSVHWDGRDSRGKEVNSGLYLYRIEAGDFTSTRKMTILR